MAEGESQAHVWGTRNVDCFEKLEQIGEGTYGYARAPGPCSDEHARRGEALTDRPLGAAYAPLAPAARRAQPSVQGEG